MRVKNSNSLPRLLSLVVVLIVTTSVISSQATLKGVITDINENSSLPAATIFIKATTTGTVADLNGEYKLALRAGTYVIQVSYIGYTTIEETVTLEDNQIFELNVAMSPASILGEEAVITAQARGQLAAVNQQLRSNQIVNVVSAERIKELPDENAAQAISRLPGVHLDGSQIVIRGVQSKMNKILINGVEMPSTEANNRASSLGMISSNMLSGIEVYKTLTPDMDADAIGGVVNLTLREAPEDFNFNLMSQGTYNQQEKILGNYKFWGDISNRFFDNKVGIAVNLNYEKSSGGNDAVSSNYERLEAGEIGSASYLSSGFTVTDRLYQSENMGGSLILDYKLPKGKLLFTSMFTRSVSDNLLYSDAVALIRDLSLDHSKSTTLLLNNSLRYEQQIGIVKLDASVSAISVDRTEDYSYSYDFRSTSDNFISDSLTNAKRLSMEPWEWYKYEVPESVENLQMYNFRWDPRTYNENQIIADINVEVPLRISDKIFANIKTGGKYKRMQREHDRTYRTYGGHITGEEIQAPMQDFLVSVGHENWQSYIWFPDFRDNEYKTNEGFMNNHEYYDMPYAMRVDYADKMAIDLMDYDLLMSQAGEFNDDYWGGEDLYAGYLMAEINLGSKLVIIPGVRYERVQNNYTAPEVAYIGQDLIRVRDTLSRPVTHENWLPHLHLRYRVTDWWDIRFSYNQTLSRPDYNHAIPSLYYNVIATTGEAGNPSIKPAKSENLDVNFTFYTGKLGLVTIGGFIKRIDDVFYSQPSLIKNLPDTTIINSFPIDQYPAMANGLTNFYINNPNRAYLRGLELEWQSNFSYLPTPFNGLVLNVNYTHVWSETDYPQHQVDKVFIPTFPYIEEVENDTVFTDRLLHQANDISNVSVGYDYKGFSARASFRFQGNVISSIAGRSEDNVYTNNIYRFDFVMKQKLPIKVINLELFFNAVNFTNAPSSRYSIYPNKGETNIYTSYSGRQFSLGVRLTK